MLPPLLVVALTIYAAVDCIQTDEHRVRNLPKLIWLLLVLFVVVVGPVCWFLAGRPQRSPSGRGPGHRGGGSPRGPDDDPDFLRNL